MSKEWAELNKTMQFKNELTLADFSAMPYMDAKGYHNKTIATNFIR